MSLDTAIIQQYYAGILRLQPSAATINAYAQLPSYEAAMDAMMNAAVASVNPITKLYQAAFDRVPDSTGLTNYTAAYGAGAGTMTLQQIANQWTGTIEFTSDYPADMPNADYVGLLYWNVLHRAADPVGAANFTTALNNGTMTRADVLLELSQSPEFAYRIDGNIRGFQEQCALNNPAAYTGTLWDKVPPGPGETFTLTTDIDTFTATTDNAVFNAVSGTGATLTTGDILTGAGGINTLRITGNGSSASTLVETHAVQNVTVRSVDSATAINQVLMSGVELFASEGSLADTLVTKADINTVYALNNTVAGQDADLRIDYASVAGKADVAKLAINNAGNKSGSTTTTQTIDLFSAGSATNAIEAVSLATAGTNYVELDSGTGAKTFTVTGSGTNDVTFTTANASLKVDASATTGNNVLRVGSALSGTSDTILGGSGDDTVVATINNTTASTIEGVETLVLDFAASSNFNGLYVDGVTTLDISNKGATGGTAATLNNIASTVDTLIFDTTTSATSTSTSVSFETGTDTDLTINVGQVTTAGTSTAITAVGALTLAGNSGGVSVTSVSDKATTINTVATFALGTATALSIDADTAGLTVGAITGTKVTSLDVNANAAKGTVTLGGFDDALALQTIAVAATAATVDLTNSTSIIGADDSLTSIVMSAETVGSTIFSASVEIGRGTNAETGSLHDVTNATLTATGSGVVNVTSNGTTTYIGTVDATENTGAVNLDFSAYTGTKGFTVTLGDAVSTDNNLVDISGGSGASVVTGGAGADSIDAGAGADVIDAGAGADTVVGNAGNDIVTLGAGSDVFAFANQAAVTTSSTVATIAQVASNVGSDVITSYVVEDDVIQLSRTVFGTSIGATGALATDHFALATSVTAAVTVQADSIVVVQATADAAASVYYVEAALSSTAMTVGTNAVLIGTVSSVSGTFASTEFTVIA